MELFNASHPLPGALSGLPPVPNAYSEPLDLLLDALRQGRALFALRAETEAAAAWLNPGRIERNLRQALMEPVRTEIWPLLTNTWLISLCVSGDIGDPGNLLHLHTVRHSLLQSLEKEQRAAAEQPAESDRPAFTLVPFAALHDTEGLQENLAELNLLLEIIVNKQLQVQFQPIVNLHDGRVFGYEALIRGPKGGLLRRPGAMFHAAEKARMISWFDLACQEQCFQQAARQGLRHLLFVNLDAEGLATLADQDRPLAVRARDCGLTPDQIVIEITERQTVGDFPRLMSDIARLREEGFKIAVDDAGAGYNSLHAIAVLRPEFVKIDRNLTRNLDVNGERRGLLATLVRYARQIGTAVLGEGAETREELSTLIDLGVTYGQGYLMGKPHDHFKGIPQNIQEFIRQRAQQCSMLAVGRSITAGGLMRRGKCVAPDVPLAEVVRSFGRDESLTSVVVVEGEIVRGLVMRRSLDHALEMAKSARLAEHLLGETIAQWMQTDVLHAPEETPVEELVQQATRRGDVSLETDIVILTSGGQYAGLLPMRVLLEALTTQQQNGRRYADPLSGLPNRVVLEQALQERLAARQPVGLVRTDISRLEPYNRCFGAAHGDEIIAALARLLQETIERHGGKDDMLTHLGGDDFVILTQSDRVPTLCKALTEGFQALIPQFYPAERVRLGYVEFTERDGNTRRFPLCSLAVAGLTGRQPRLVHSVQALGELHSLLRAVQSLAGSRYAIDVPPPESRRHTA